MATATLDHDYIEAVATNHAWVKTGEIRLLWGMIVIPMGYMEKNITNLGICRLCKQKYVEHIKRPLEVKK